MLVEYPSYAHWLMSFKASLVALSYLCFIVLIRRFFRLGGYREFEEWDNSLTVLKILIAWMLVAATLPRLVPYWLFQIVIVMLLLSHLYWLILICRVLAKAAAHILPDLDPHPNNGYWLAHSPPTNVRIHALGQHGQDSSRPIDDYAVIADEDRQLSLDELQRKHGYSKGKAIYRAITHSEEQIRS